MRANDHLGPTIFAIFGGAGDLAWRKLVPALYDLSRDRSLPERFAIVAVDRAETSDAALRQHLHEGVNEFSRNGKAAPDVWAEFARHIHYLAGDFKKAQTYKELAERIAEIESEWGIGAAKPQKSGTQKSGTGTQQTTAASQSPVSPAAGHSPVQGANRIFYMATPPSLFGEIPKYLGHAGLARGCKLSRIVVEKPIGYDLESARSLNATLGEYFDESQIFRIDHYLGKETVQNILAFRFANPLFEPIWNRRYVAYVTITAAETVGVEHRGGYYEGAGALRDMAQNHLMQLLCLVAMEPMVSFDADEIRNKKADVLHAVRPIHHDAVHEYVVRGQYGRGWIDGKEAVGYREEEGVSPESQTETFVAMKLFLDNWRWQDVPFYLRTGKRLGRQSSEIAIQFRAVPHQSFPPEATLDWQPSRLVICISPDEGIVLRFQAKHPGTKMHLRTVEMKFNYQETFGHQTPEAYETLLWDIMQGDATLFMRSDQVEAAWRLLMPVLEVWAVAPPSDFPNYAAGSWGPEAAQGLLAQLGHSWPLPTELGSCKGSSKRV